MLIRPAKNVASAPIGTNYSLTLPPSSVYITFADDVTATSTTRPMKARPHELGASTRDRLVPANRMNTDAHAMAALVVLNNADREIATINILADHARLSLIARERIDESLEAIRGALNIRRSEFGLSQRTRAIS